MAWDQYLRTVADVLDAPGPDFVHVPTELLLEHLPGDRTAVLERVTQYSFPYDVGKAARDLDYAPPMSWAEGVERVVEWLDDHDEFPRDDPLEDPVVDAWREAETAFGDALDMDGE